MCGERVRRVSEKLRTSALSARSKDADGIRDPRQEMDVGIITVTTGDWRLATGSSSRAVFSVDSGHSQLYLKLCAAQAEHSAESHHGRQPTLGHRCHFSPNLSPGTEAVTGHRGG